MYECSQVLFITSSCSSLTLSSTCAGEDGDFPECTASSAFLQMVISHTNLEEMQWDSSSSSSFSSSSSCRTWGGTGPGSDVTEGVDRWTSCVVMVFVIRMDVQFGADDECLDLPHDNDDNKKDESDDGGGGEIVRNKMLMIKKDVWTHLQLKPVKRTQPQQWRKTRAQLLGDRNTEMMSSYDVILWCNHWARLQKHCSCKQELYLCLKTRRHSNKADSPQQSLLFLYLLTSLSDSSLPLQVQNK